MSFLALLGATTEEGYNALYQLEDRVRLMQTRAPWNQAEIARLTVTILPQVGALMNENKAPRAIGFDVEDWNRRAVALRATWLPQVNHAMGIGIDLTKPYTTEAKEVTQSGSIIDSPSAPPPGWGGVLYDPPSPSFWPSQCTIAGQNVCLLGSVAFGVFVLLMAFKRN